MSRNLIEANKAIFQSLDAFCAIRGVRLANAGASRWIGTQPLHRNFMMNARVVECVHFTPGRKLAHLKLSTKSFLCSVGFEQANSIFRDTELEVDAGHLTVALSELEPRPTASPVMVRDALEWTDKEADPNYKGYAFEQVGSLFPLIRIYSVQDRSKDVIWSTFFRMCLDECELGFSWVEGSLLRTLRSMCDLDQSRIPYRVLCRSIFDGDKSSFFLALYRCLEALYAYSSARVLATSLNLTVSWDKIAQALEDKLGWYPREEGSLARILHFAAKPDLQALCTCVKEVPPADSELLVDRAAKIIYRLRNSIVHYRPAQHATDLQQIEWLPLCEALVGIVVDVYEVILGSS